MKKIWQKIKSWVYALLVSLGLIVPILAATKDFTYTAATQYEDGTPMPLSHIAETRLYCDGATTPTAVEPGADGGFTVTLSPGSHTCYATHFGTNGLESLPSNSVTFEVLPEVAPNPPTNLQVN